MPNTLIDLAPAELSQAYAQWRCRKRAAVVAALNLAPGVSYVEKQIKLLRPKLPPLSYLKILLGVESDHELAKLLRVRHRSVTIALRTASHGRTNSSDSGRVLSELPLEIAAALSEGEGFRLLEDMQTSQCRYAKIRNPFD